MSASVAITKPVLRAAALARRDRLAPDERAHASAAIASRCALILAGLRFACLSGFLPIGSECDPRPIMESAAASGATVALPAFVDRQTMVFRQYAAGDPLVPAGFGTREPVASAMIVEPDILLMPLASYDRDGSRLGYGKGHYDTTIGSMREAGLRPLLIGLAFSVQEVDAIPVEPHDVRLDWLVNEIETLDFRQAPD